MPRRPHESLGKRTPAKPDRQTQFHRVQRAAQEAIAQRAYEFFAQRGGEHGHDLDDWLLAQQELIVPVPVEVAQDGKEIIVRLQAPGFGLADLGWDIQDRRLAVAGHHERTVQGSDGQRAYSDTRVRFLLELLALPAEVDSEEARITMVNDVVEVRLPLRQPMARYAAHAA